MIAKRERRGWWKDLLAGAATLMDIAGTGTARGWRTATPTARVTWAVTSEDLGPGWARQEVAGVEPVPAQVTWIHALWRAQQEAEAECTGMNVTRPVQVWITTRDVRHADGNVMLVRDKVHRAWAELIECAANDS